jgi:hypothetical protein
LVKLYPTLADVNESFNGQTCDDAYFVASTSRLTNLNFKAGSGDLSFPDPGDDPIAA